MVLPPPPCFFCTLQNGVYISKNDGSVQRLRNDNDQFINATCPEKYQCVGHEAVVSIENIGCCVPCSFEQACAESTISQHHPFTDNICPDGYLCDDPSAPQPCSIGELCKYNLKVDCKIVQKNATDSGIGVVFDGTYCNEKSATINNCPTGYYCPTAREKIKCPAGFFCPMKSKRPEIKCSKCDEGSIKRVRDNSVAMVAVAVFVLLLIMYLIMPLIKTLFQSKSSFTIKSPKTSKDQQIETSSSPPSKSIEKDLCGVEMRYMGLSLTLRRKMSSPNHKSRSKCILNNISGKISPQRLCAILGESGTGKSTLLKVLSGRGYCAGDVKGNVFINNVEFKGCEWNCSSIGRGDAKSIISYVPQEDVVFSELTVWENLYWAGRFHLAGNTGRKKIEFMANKVIRNLALEHIRNVQVGGMFGGISGGERRRVSIGIALMSKPRVLLCDEVTSGLDSSNSMMVMTMLKNLAHTQNISVLCSIHQPRQQIFSILDDLVLLSKGGNVLYTGEAKRAVEYFQTVGFDICYDLNPADFLVDLSTGNAHDSTGRNLSQHELCSKWALHTKDDLNQSMNSISNQAKNQNFRLDRHPKPSPIHQFVLQLGRIFLFFRRNFKEKMINTFVIALGSAVMSSVEGIFPLVDEFAEHQISFEDVVSRELPIMDMYQFSVIPIRSKLHFAMKISAICGVLTSFAASRNISSKKSHVYHELASGHNPSSYFLAVTTIGVFEHGFQMMLAGALSYWILQPLQPLFFYTINFFMLSFVMSGWGHLFALLIPIENLTLTSGAILLCLSLLYSGVTNPATFEEIYKNSRTAIIAGLLSPSRYFVETLVVSELQCYPEQYGFTTPSSIEGDDTITPSDALNFTALDHLHLAKNDKGTFYQNCNGWYYNFPHYIITGMILRVVSLILINFSHQNRRDIFYLLKKGCCDNKLFVLYQVFLILLLISLVKIAISMMVNKDGHE